MMIPIVSIGCSKSVIDKVNSLDKPILLISKSKKGGIILQGSSGEIVSISGGYYIAQSIIESDYKVGDIVFPEAVRKNSKWD